MRLLVIASIWLGATLWFGVANTEAGFVADANIDDSGTLTVSFQNDTEQVIKLSNIRIEAPGHPACFAMFPPRHSTRLRCDLSCPALPRTAAHEGRTGGKMTGALGLRPGASWDLDKSAPLTVRF
jgi:hypothetical protein